MQYRAKYAAVEALPVTLDGHERMVFSSGGQFHIMPIDLFELLYVLAPAVGPAPEAPPLLTEVARQINKPAEKTAAPAAKRTGRPRKPVPAPAERLGQEPAGGRPAAKGEILGVTPPSVIQAVVLAIKEKPRTTAEVADRVISVFQDASRPAVWGYVSGLIREGKVERRDDPVTQISHLFLLPAKADA